MSVNLSYSPDLNEGIKKLGDFAKLEYHIDFDEFISNLSDSNKCELAKRRFLRLLGVQIKEPFADAFVDPSKGVISGSETKAFRAWNWNKEKGQDLRRSNPEKFKLIDEIVKGDSFLERFWDEYKSPSSDEYKSPSLNLGNTPKESDIAMKLFLDLRKYICYNIYFKNEIDRAVYFNYGPKSKISAAGPAICDLITKAIPYGKLLKHLVGEIAVFIIVVKTDGLCNWNPRVTDEDYSEKKLAALKKI
jgi:hypothetical protein